MEWTEERMQLALTNHEGCLFHFRQYLAVPNVSYGLHTVIGPREVDLLALSSAGHFHAVEIKVSKSDLINDKKKRCHQFGEPPGVKCRWFAVPEDMVECAVIHVPDNCGIVAVSKMRDEGLRQFRNRIVRRPKPNNQAPKATVEIENAFLRLGVMRMWSKRGANL